MNRTLIAKASITINTPRARVWDALVTPETIKRYMFGTEVTSQWREGSAITWRGEWQGRAYEDKGVILQIKPGRTLRYSHFSPLSGSADSPENYHTVTIELSDDDGRTQVSLVQDNNPTDQAREHSEKNWAMMLDALKKLLEQ
jgi:uncharacterized protein YndB with AHSA1/START domain